MAPAVALRARDDSGDIANTRGRASLPLDGVIVEAWAEGYQVGSLVILILLVVCNYRRHVWLHKLIVLEMILALWHGTFIFFPDPTYGWYLSATALLLFISYQLHNVISYLKIRLFLPRTGRLIFIVTLILVQPFWIVEAWDNFTYFNQGSDVNNYTRPWEALARDPWWIFTTCWLLYQIKIKYQFSMVALLKISPRFGVMVFCMFLSIVFMLVDVVVTAKSVFQDTGINPFWRLTLVFKCAADTIFLDDFKSVLDKIIDKRFANIRRSSGMDANGPDMPTVIRETRQSLPSPPRGSEGDGPASRKHSINVFGGRRRSSSRPPEHVRSGSLSHSHRYHDDPQVSPHGVGFQHLEHVKHTHFNPSPFGPPSPPPDPLQAAARQQNQAPLFVEKRPSETSSASSRIPLQTLPSEAELPGHGFY